MMMKRLGLLGVLLVAMTIILQGQDRGRWLNIAKKADTTNYGGCSVSTSGTRVPDNGSSLTDSGCHVWTFGSGTSPSITVLIDGSSANGGFGYQMLYYMGSVYVLGQDSSWYLWGGSSYTNYGNDPELGGVAPTGFFVSNGTNGPVGLDSRNCATASNVATPKLTLDSALMCVSAGSTLWVRGGTYDEHISNNVPSGTSWSNKVRIAAYPAETVWIKPTSNDATNSSIYFSSGQQYIEFDGINIDATTVGPGGSQVHAGIFLDNRPVEQQPGVIEPNYIRFKNFEFKNHGNPGGGGAAISLGGNHHEVINAVVHGTGGPYAFYVSGNYTLIDHCEAYDTSFYGMQIYSDHLDSTGWPTGNVVRNSTFHDINESQFFGVNDVANRLGGVQVFGIANEVYNNVFYNISLARSGYVPGSQIAISGYQAQSSLVYNNTVYGNQTACIDMKTDSQTTGNIVRNNICYGNSDNSVVSGTAGTADHNLTSGNPLFVNALTFNFRLSSTSSPAYNTGTTVTTATFPATAGTSVSTDPDGTARPQSTAFDIGAFEGIH